MDVHQSVVRTDRKIFELPPDILGKGLRKTRKELIRLLLSPIRMLPEAAPAVLCSVAEGQRFTPEQVILNYCQGIFALGKKSGVQWDDPPERAILPLDNLHIEKTVAKKIKKGTFDITFDRDFGRVIRECADRSKTWLTPEIIETYEELHRWGVAHSIEAWKDGELVGGNFGAAIGSLFIGESMFFRVRDASKITVAHLVDHLRKGGFRFIDCQYPTDHLMRMGAIKISRAEYKTLLARSLTERATFLR